MTQEINCPVCGKPLNAVLNKQGRMQHGDKRLKSDVWVCIPCRRLYRLEPVKVVDITSDRDE